jgi:biopolymer transport protein ExbD
MSKRIQRSSQDQAETDMTPMLDIVFIMLIFFIVTTSFVKETGLSAHRPADKSSIEPTLALSVQIDQNGTIFMDNREVDLRRVNANVLNYMANNNTDSATIVAHSKTKHGVVVEVMDQIKQASIDKVSVLVK